MADAPKSAQRAPLSSLVAIWRIAVRYPGHIAAALVAQHDGWAGDDTALLALRVPPRA